MFNLLMFGVDWEPDWITIPDSRMFEYTEDHITGQFKKGTEPLLDRLRILPCLFCTEGKTNQTARVGQINQARIAGRKISLEISFDEKVPSLQNSLIYANREELHMSDIYEFQRSHWAVKDADLYRFLLRNVRFHRQRPTVFRISEYEDIRSERVSAMMPFDPNFDSVYEAIRQASVNSGLECKRADNFWQNNAIIQDVVELIDRSRIVVCDCSNRNPNVFYETGIAHTLGRDVILITQNEHDIPFDLRHLRHIHYYNNGEGRAALTRLLQERMRTLLDN